MFLAKCIKNCRGSCVYKIPSTDRQTDRQAEINNIPLQLVVRSIMTSLGQTATRPLITAFGICKVCPDIQSEGKHCLSSIEDKVANTVYLHSLETVLLFCSYSQVSKYHGASSESVSTHQLFTEHCIDYLVTTCIYHF